MTIESHQFWLTVSVLLLCYAVILMQGEIDTLFDERDLRSSASVIPLRRGRKIDPPPPKEPA